jgi:hypothetical protein
VAETPERTAPTADDVRAALHALFIGAAGTTLRKEDETKVKELVPLLAELGRVATRPSGVFVDACAGKSALGLIAAKLVLPAGWRVVVVERDPASTAAARAAAARVDACAVDVSESDVDGFDFGGVHVVAGLHACGAASDAIIDAAIAARVRHLLLVPCCYGAHPAKTSTAMAQVPGQRWAASLIDALPRQGVVGRRAAQALIDAERTLRLEAGGYDVDVVEFVAPTVTPHNLLWRARFANEPKRRAEAEARRGHWLPRI